MASTRNTVNASMPAGRIAISTVQWLIAGRLRVITRLAWVRGARDGLKLATSNREGAGTRRAGPRFMAQ